MSAVELDANSLERIVPDELRSEDRTGAETLRLSTERYEFASNFASRGRVLDLACGVGYGTRILTDGSPAVRGIGVDLAESAIEYANERYGNDRTSYEAHDAMGFQDPDGFETVVSIETIEHLPDPSAFVARVAKMVLPGGILIGSVPVTPSVDANPHHLHDFSERSFRRLFEPHGFLEVDRLEQDQPFELFSVLSRSESRMQDMRENLVGYYLRHPGALVRRGVSTLRHGFKNRYLTVAWRRDS